jgi:pimeloyl-ACP methyl ester carboxylesterase
MSAVRASELGDGERLVFVHGSFVPGGATWVGQRPLAERYRLVFVDRRGYGGSEAVPGGEDFERDAEDVAGLLEAGAHLVGHSYGAVVSLLASGLRPDALWSLTLIEPPAFQLATDSSAARGMRERLTAVMDAAATYTPEAFYPAFLQAMGYDLETLGLQAWSELDIGLGAGALGAFRTSMFQRMAWTAAVPLDRIAGAPWPKLVISGDWSNASEATRATAGAGLNAVCDVLAPRIGATRSVIPGARHSPHRTQPGAFNECLRRFLASAPAGLAPGGVPARPDGPGSGGPALP